MAGEMAGEKAGENVDALRARLEVYVGKPMGPGAMAPDPVNVPMIRHWVDALDDRNPVYLDEELAATTRFGGIVAPPAMLQTWTMARPRIEGIAERGGAPVEMDFGQPDPHPRRGGLRRHPGDELRARIRALPEARGSSAP